MATTARHWLERSPRALPYARILCLATESARRALSDTEAAFVCWGHCTPWRLPAKIGELPAHGLTGQLSVQLALGWRLSGRIAKWTLFAEGAGWEQARTVSATHTIYFAREDDRPHANADGNRPP